jgi:competence protein ComEC
LEKVSPELAVISVGENKYGHPHKETLEILEKYGIRILRTDREGDIKVFSDGNTLKIKN